MLENADGIVGLGVSLVAVGTGPKVGLGFISLSKLGPEKENSCDEFLPPLNRWKSCRLVRVEPNCKLDEFLAAKLRCNVNVKF